MNDYSYGFSFHGEEIVLEVDIESNCTALCIYQTPVNIKFMLCHFNRIQYDIKNFNKVGEAFIE